MIDKHTELQIKIGEVKVDLEYLNDNIDCQLVKLDVEKNNLMEKVSKTIRNHAENLKIKNYEFFVYEGAPLDLNFSGKEVFNRKERVHKAGGITVENDVPVASFYFEVIFKNRIIKDFFNLTTYENNIE